MSGLYKLVDKANREANKKFNELAKKLKDIHDMQTHLKEVVQEMEQGIPRDYQSRAA